MTLNKGTNRVLYASETAARAVGSQITLHAFDAGKLAAGMPIRYLGIDIGQVESLQLAPERNEVQANAVLYPEYVQTFARLGSRFSVVTPQISAAGVEHPRYPVAALHQRGAGPRPRAAHRDFELQEATITDSRYLDGLSIVVEAAGSGLAADRHAGAVPRHGGRYGHRPDAGYALRPRNGGVAHQQERYQHLVRNNTVFWLASGYTLDFGLTGGVVKTGTFNQFIRGGIAFATPPGTPLAPKAQPGKHFLLHPEENRKSGTNLGHRPSARLNFAFSSGPGIVGPCFFPLCDKLSPLSLLHPESSPRGQIHRRFSSPANSWTQTRGRMACPPSCRWTILSPPASARCAAVFASTR